MSMYIITHKKFNKPSEDGYKVILVGAHKGHVYGDVFDDEGDNISEKNPNYCELTGIYWLWKNCKDDYIGITHYRRYFANHLSGKRITSEKDILKKLKNADVITPFMQTLPVSIQEHYCEESGLAKDLDRVGEIISEKYPDYLDAYNKILNGNQMYFYNMMVARKDIYDAYCSWLFDILFELEKGVNLDEYNDYQKRIYGFLSERLLNVYIEKNNLKRYEMGVIQPEDKWGLKKRVLTALKRTLRYRFS